VRKGILHPCYKKGGVLELKISEDMKGGPQAGDLKEELCVQFGVERGSIRKSWLRGGPRGPKKKNPTNHSVENRKV